MSHEKSDVGGANGRSALKDEPDSFKITKEVQARFELMMKDPNRLIIRDGYAISRYNPFSAAFDPSFKIPVPEKAKKGSKKSKEEK